MEKEKINILSKENQTEKTEKEEVNKEQSSSKRNDHVLTPDKPKKKEYERERHTPSYLREVLETTRPVKVTKGGRRFSFTSLVLIKDKEKKAIAYARGKGKETMVALQKACRKAQKKLITYFPNPPRTIPYQVLVKDGATKIFFKPSPPGSGIKAGGVLSKLFKYLEIKDVSAKIIGSRNKTNVVRVAFKALDKLTGKKYGY